MTGSNEIALIEVIGVQNKPIDHASAHPVKDPASHPSPSDQPSDKSMIDRFCLRNTLADVPQH
jgi:hypothetical protein